MTDLIPHLFRTEFRKITAVLCARFGTAVIDTAEDIASDAFLSALETWPYKGIPENPTAWLYTVAKNKASNLLKHEEIFGKKVASELKQSQEIGPGPEIDWSESNINDSQLQMLFWISDPDLPVGTQIALALRFLAGFGIDEIAAAFLTGKETIQKRLARGKEKLRQLRSPPGPGTDKGLNFTDFISRLESVLSVLYLLFSEGYFSETKEKILREDLCVQAMQLTYLLLQNQLTNKPGVNALFALMCFHSSRFEARKNENGEMILYEDQDRQRWDTGLIDQGIVYLKLASTGNAVSKYHLEAGIAYWHTVKTDSAEKWDQILQLYNHRLQLQYSPVAALNRTYAYSKKYGKSAAIKEAERLNLTKNYLYYLLLGELYTGVDNQKALRNLKLSISLTKTSSAKAAIQTRIKKLRA